MHTKAWILRHYPNERHYIRNLFGGILRKGIFVDQSKNGRIENVHFSQNYWVRASLGHPDEYWGPLFADSYLNLTAFKFAKADNEYVTNTFAIPCKIGYHFAKSKYGACSGVFSGIGIDFTQQPILIEETQAALSYISLCNMDRLKIASLRSEKAEIFGSVRSKKSASSVFSYLQKLSANDKTDLSRSIRDFNLRTANPALRLLYLIFLMKDIKMPYHR